MRAGRAVPEVWFRKVAAWATKHYREELAKMQSELVFAVGTMDSGSFRRKSRPRASGSGGRGDTPTSYVDAWLKWIK